MIDLNNTSATGILHSIKQGEITSRQVVEHFIGQINKVNPSLNAIVIELFDQALKKADEAD